MLKLITFLFISQAVLCTYSTTPSYAGIDAHKFTPGKARIHHSPFSTIISNQRWTGADDLHEADAVLSTINAENKPIARAVKMHIDPDGGNTAIIKISNQSELSKALLKNDYVNLTILWNHGKNNSRQISMSGKVKATEKQKKGKVKATGMVSFHDKTYTYDVYEFEPDSAKVYDITWIEDEEKAQHGIVERYVYTLNGQRWSHKKTKGEQIFPVD